MGHGLLLWAVRSSMWPLFQASVQPENARRSYTSPPLGGAANADEPLMFEMGLQACARAHTHTTTII